MLALASAAALALAGCGSNSSTSANDSSTHSNAAAKGSYSIGIMQYVSHPSLDAAREGFKQALAHSGLQVEFTEQNAQGDQATVTSIANQFATNHFDLVLAIATPTAQAAYQAIADTPVLFTAVTDPVAAQLVDSNEKPGKNVTGTTDMNPVAQQIDLIKQVKPDAASVGIIYSSGEVNSAVQVKIAKAEAAKQGLRVVEKTITNSSEVVQAAHALGSVDSIYVPTDNLVVSALDSVLQFAEGTKIPVIVGETSSVSAGGLGTVGLSYQELGEQTGQMAVKILKDGADPATMPVEAQKEPKLVLNKGAAARMGVTLPQELLSKADNVIE